MLKFPFEALKKLIEKKNKDFEEGVKEVSSSLKKLEPQILQVIKSAAEANLKKEESKMPFKKVKKLFADEPITVENDVDGWKITINYIDDFAKSIVGMWDKGSGTVVVPATLGITNLLKKLKNPKTGEAE
jgi:hypothetical protein